jgi:hypothetical protein
VTEYEDGRLMDEFTVGQLIGYLQDNYDPAQPVVLVETSITPVDAVAMPDVFQGMREG